MDRDISSDHAFQLIPDQLVLEGVQTPFIVGEVPPARVVLRNPLRIEAAKKGRPSVVFIRSTKGPGKTKKLGDNTGGSTGSGVIISADGYIATKKCQRLCQYDLKVGENPRAYRSDHRLDAKRVGSRYNATRDHAT